MLAGASQQLLLWQGGKALLWLSLLLPLQLFGLLLMGLWSGRW